MFDISRLFDLNVPGKMQSDDGLGAIHTPQLRRQRTNKEKNVKSKISSL